MGKSLDDPISKFRWSIKDLLPNLPHQLITYLQGDLPPPFLVSPRTQPAPLIARPLRPAMAGYLLKLNLCII